MGQVQRQERRGRSLCKGVERRRLWRTARSVELPRRVPCGGWGDAAETQLERAQRSLLQGRTSPRRLWGTSQECGSPCPRPWTSPLLSSLVQTFCLSEASALCPGTLPPPCPFAPYCRLPRDSSPSCSGLPPPGWAQLPLLLRAATPCMGPPGTPPAALAPSSPCLQPLCPQPPAHLCVGLGRISGCSPSAPCSPPP